MIVRCLAAAHQKLGLGLFLGLGLVCGCHEDGASASCPDLPLYDVRSDAALDPAIVEARETAAAAGCLTLEGDAHLLDGGGTLETDADAAGESDGAADAHDAQAE